jgi:hypothetical protein
MPNFRRLGALQVYQLPAPEAQSLKGRFDFRFEILDWGTFSERASSPRFPVTGRSILVYILLNFVKFLKK